MSLHESKRRAIIDWFTYLTSSNRSKVRTVTDLVDAEQLFQIASSIHPNPDGPVNSKEEIYEYLKEFINGFFNLKIETLIDFSCIESDELELSKLLVFLLSAMVQSLLPNDNPVLNTLIELENNIQEDIRECMFFVISYNSLTQSKDDFHRILCQARDGGDVSGKASTSISHKTPTRKSKRGGSKKTSSAKKSKAKKAAPMVSSSPQTPIKILLDSPLMMQQVANRNKDREIKKLREQLHAEESKAIDLTNENENLRKDLETKGEKIRHLKEKLDEYHNKEDDVNENQRQLELYEGSLREISSLHEKIRECEEANGLLRQEVADLSRANASLEGKVGRLDELKACTDEIQLQFYSLKNQHDEKTLKLEEVISQNSELEVLQKDLENQVTVFKDMYDEAAENLKKLQEVSNSPEGENLQYLFACEEIKELQELLRNKEAEIESLKKENHHVAQETQTSESKSESYDWYHSNLNVPSTSRSNFVIHFNESHSRPVGMEQGTQTEESSENISHDWLHTNSDDSLSKPNFRIHYNESSTSNTLPKVSTRRGIRHTPPFKRFSHSSEGDRTTRDSTIKKRLEFCSFEDEPHLAEFPSRNEMIPENETKEASLSILFLELEEQLDKMNSMEGNAGNVMMSDLVQRILQCVKNCITFYEKLRNMYENLCHFERGNFITKGEILGFMRSGLINLEIEGRDFINFLKDFLKQIRIMKHPPKSDHSAEANNKEVDELKNIIKDLTEKDNVNRQKLSEVTSSIVDLQVKCVELEQKYSEELAKNKVAANYQMVKESEINGYQLEIQALQAENTKLKAAYQKKKAAVESYAEEMTETRKVVDQMNEKREAQVKIYKQEKEKYRLKYEAAKKSAESLENKISEKDELLNKYSAQLKSCQNKLEAKKEDVKKLSQLLEGEKNKVESLHSDVDSLRVNVASLKSKIQAQQQDLMISKKENTALAEALEVAKGKLGERQVKADKVKFREAVQKRLSSMDYSKLFSVEDSSDKPDVKPRLLGKQLRLDGVNCDENSSDTSFASMKSNGFNKSYFNGKNEDEEVFLNHSSLTELTYNPPTLETPSKRINELRRRNTLCPPHLRTTYPVELQELPTTYSSNTMIKALESTKKKDKHSRPFFKNKRIGSFTPKKLFKKIRPDETCSSSSVPKPTPSPPTVGRRPFTTPASVRRLLVRRAMVKAKKQKEGSKEEPFVNTDYKFSF